MPRSREEKARAIARVQADGAVPMSELASMAGSNERSMIRWATDGRHGIYLDAINRAGKWFSSPAAIARFLAEVARAEEEQEERRGADATTGGRA